MPYRWQLCRTIISDVDLSSLSTTASPLSAMVPASSLVAQSENFFSPLPFFPCVIHYTVDGDVCHSSYSQVGLLWSRGRALLLRLLCGLQVEPFQLLELVTGLIRTFKNDLLLKPFSSFAWSELENRSRPTGLKANGGRIAGFRIRVYLDTSHQLYHYIFRWS